MDFNSYLRASKKMEEIFGEKITVLHDLLLHHRPSAVLKDEEDVNVIVYNEEVTLTIIQFGEDYIAVLRLSDELSERLKIPSVITTLIPGDIVDITDPRDVVETFIASVQTDLTDFLR